MTQGRYSDQDLRDAITTAQNLSAQLERVQTAKGQKTARAVSPVSPYVSDLANLFPPSTSPQPVRERAHTADVDERKRRMLLDMFGPQLTASILGEKVVDARGDKTGPMRFADLQTPSDADLDQAGETMRLGSVTAQMQTLLDNITAASDLSVGERYDLLVQAGEGFLEKVRRAGVKASNPAYRNHASPYTEDLKQLFGGRRQP